MSVRRRVILGSSLLVLTLVAAYFFMKSGGSEGTEPERAGAGDGAEAVQVASSGSAPPDCRYSIVPGGVYSRDEVRAVVKLDAVVAAHYSPVDIGSLRAERATEGRRVFVSYRVRDEVYWSHERVALEAGEMILTDGRIEIRARCGNLVSLGVPLGAVREASADVPAAAELDEIETGSSPTANTAAAGGDPIEPVGTGAIGLPAPGQVPANPGLGGSTSPMAPWVFAGGRGGSSGAGSPGGTTGGIAGGGGIGGSGLTGGGIADDDVINGGGDTDGGGSNGGIGSGDGGGADGGRAGGGGGSGDVGGGNPGGGTGPGGPGSGDDGGSPASPNSNPEGPGNGNPGGPGNENPEGPGNGNPGGPGTGGPGTDPGFVVVPSDDSAEPTPVRVPEPTTLSLLAIGIGGAALAGRRRTRQR